LNRNGVDRLLYTLFGISLIGCFFLVGLVDWLFLPRTIMI
jgi:hypothetical protein